MQLPVLKFQMNINPLVVPWNSINEEFSKAPAEHDLEKGNSLSTWDWSENYRRDLEYWFKPVREQIAQVVQEYTGSQDLYEDWVMNSWMNRHYRSGQTAQHEHKGADLVFSCYLSVPENSGAFLLEWQGAWWRIPVTTGDMLCFPGELNHATEASCTDEPRVVLTVNASPTGILWRNIPDPGDLINQGMTMPQALGQIRHDYLTAHKIFAQRKESIIQQFSAITTVVAEPGNYQVQSI